jgi:flagellar hook-length control protein FliK
MRDEAKSADEGKQADKNTVNIRELLKFGVTDVSLSIDLPPTLQQTTTEVTQTLQTTAQTVSQTVQTQATPMASTSVETNGERRTIADDIRLRALERMIVNAARNGTQVLSIQLYPPGLGQVVLRLAMDGQRLRLATRAATTEAADTLRNMEADLRDALSGNGLQLAGFDVSEDGTNDEAPHRKPTQPDVKTRNGGTTESFTIDLNA